MKAKPWHQDVRWRVAALVFATLLLVGTACWAWAMHQWQHQQAQASRQHTQAMAQSVAQALAQQLSRAVRLGIPLSELPGLPQHLQEALDKQPTLSGIAVHLPDGHTLVAAGTGASTAAQAHAPIAGVGEDAGTVQVSADGGPSSSLQQARGLALLGVLVLAGCVAGLAGLSVGARLERQRRLAWQQLDPGAAATPLGTARLGGADAHGPLALLYALAVGQGAVSDARQALQAQTQELLAVDFDGQMQVRIAAVWQRVDAAAPE